MSWVREFPLSVLPPGLLLVAWLALWMVKGRITWWFFAGGTGLALLCFPIGVVGTSLDGPCSNPNHDTWACGMVSAPMASAWLGGFLALCCLAMLTPATLLVNAFGRDGDR